MNDKELSANNTWEAVANEFSEAFEAVYGHHVEAGLTETLKALNPINFPFHILIL